MTQKNLKTCIETVTKLSFGLILLMVGCVSGTTSTPEVNRFISNFSKTAKLKNGVTFEGVGLSFPKDTILLMDVSFHSNEQADIDQARQMIVPLTEDFVRAYRSDPGLAVYLPTGSNIRDGVLVSISYDLRNAPLNQCSNLISLVFFNQHRLVYFTPSNDPTGQKKILEEPYAEAYEKVMGTPLNHKM